jgi:hypothetical protein
MHVTGQVTDYVSQKVTPSHVTCQVMFPRSRAPKSSCYEVRFVTTRGECGKLGWEGGQGKTPSLSPATEVHVGQTNMTRDGGERGRTKEGSLRGENGQQNGRERKERKKRQNRMLEE